LIRVRNIRALNGRFNTSITHAYSIVIGSKHITLNATGGGFLTASKQFRHGATSKSRSNTRSEERRVGKECGTRGQQYAKGNTRRRNREVQYQGANEERWDE